MKNQGKKSWTLYATKRPTEPGIYFVGILYYPEDPYREKLFLENGVENKHVHVITNVRDDMTVDYGVSEECIVWWGPVLMPVVLKRTMTRLKKEQRKVFVRDNEKYCNQCGTVSAVNSRSILYSDDTEDCRKCGAVDSVLIRLKQKK